jgi:aspartyl-tRNA synthetase
VTDNSPGSGGDILATDLPGDLDLSAAWWQRIAPAAATRGMRLMGFLDALESRSFAPVASTSAELTTSLRLAPEWQPGLVPVWRGSWRLAHRLVKLLYRSLAQTVAPPDTLRFAWVIDFPLFETDPATGSLVSVNHPFCAPADPAAFSSARTRSELVELRSTSFDLVLNGEELGSGSVVNHRTDIQERVLELLGVSRSQRDQSFSFVLESMRFGAPPVAGFGPMTLS